MKTIENKVDSLYNSLSVVVSEEKLLDIFDPIINDIEDFFKKETLQEDQTLYNRIQELMDIYEYIETFMVYVDDVKTINSVKEYLFLKKEFTDICLALKQFPVVARVHKEIRALDEKFHNVDCSNLGLQLDEMEKNPPKCRCGNPMVLRANRSTGEHFFGCSGFPKCRSTRPIEI